MFVLPPARVDVLTQAQPAKHKAKWDRAAETLDAGGLPGRYLLALHVDLPRFANARTSGQGSSDWKDKSFRLGVVCEFGFLKVWIMVCFGVFTFF